MWTQMESASSPALAHSGFIPIPEPLIPAKPESEENGLLSEF